MTPLSRNTRRRLFLYGTATVLAVAILFLPRIISRLAPAVRVRNLLREADAAMENEATRHLVALLRIDTSNPPDVTKGAILYLARFFECEGIPFEVVGEDPERPILVARLKGTGSGEGLALLHHVDVVPAGDLRLWSEPPFEGRRGGREARHYLYGRGALDMKAQAVASFMAMASLKRSGIVPRRDVVFVAESAEETFQLQYGVGWVLDHRPDLLAGVGDFVNEGGVNEAIGPEIQRYGIEVLQEGVVSLWIDAPSKESLEEFRTFLKAADAALKYRLDPTVREFLRFIAPSRAALWGRAMLGSGETLLSEPLLKEMPEVYRSLLRDHIYSGTVGPGPAGGFTMRLVRTLLPGSPTRAAREEVVAWARERGFKVRDHVMTYDATPSAPTGRAWEALQTALLFDPHETAPVGIYVLSGSFTSSSLLRSRGLRAFGVSPFNVGLYDARKIHSPNERISLPHFIDGVERIRHFVYEYALAP